MKTIFAYIVSVSLSLTIGILVASPLGFTEVVESQQLAVITQRVSINENAVKCHIEGGDYTFTYYTFSEKPGETCKISKELKF